MDDFIIIIPARSGSKGLKNKNIYKINSLTLLENTIIQAKEITNAENIYLSTDSKKYIDLTNYLNVKNNGIRPKRLSSDNSKIFDVIEYELNMIKNCNFYKCIEKKICIILEPSFYGKRENIKFLLDLYKGNSDIKSIFGVDTVPLKYNFQKQYLIKNSKVCFVGDNFKINRQDLPQTYIRSGEFYSFVISDFFLQRTIFPNNIHILKTKTNYVNIDTKDDVNLIKNNKRI